MTGISYSILQQKASKIKIFFTDVDGTLTDGKVYYSADGEVMKLFSLRDGAGFFQLHQHGIKSGIITTEDSPIVAKRAEKLKVDAYLYGMVDKFMAMQTYLNQVGLSFDQVAYIGDEVNDLEVMKHCGLRFAVADANEMIMDIADITCSHNGGDHAFREAVSVLLHLMDNNE